MVPCREPFSGILNMSRHRLYFFPVLNILLRSGGRVEVAFAFGDHDCRYVFIVTSLSIFFDFAIFSSISTSATRAHVSLHGPMVVYFFSHMIWIAAFLALMSSKLIAPFSGGLFITFRLTEGLPPHTKLFIFFAALLQPLGAFLGL